MCLLQNKVLFFMGSNLHDENLEIVVFLAVPAFGIVAHSAAIFNNDKLLINNLTLFFN